MDVGAPPINEIVGLLGKFEPNALEKLKAVVARDIHPLLIPGGLMGAKGAFIRSRSLVAQKALEELQPLCTRGIEVAEKRLVWSKRLRLAGEIVAILGSASVIGSLAKAGESSKAIALISGGVALVGSFLSLFSTYFTRLQDEKKSLFEIYVGLVELRLEASQLLQDLNGYLNAGEEGDYDAELTDVVAKANGISKRAYMLLPELLILKPRL
jgi:hypothetical protein